MQGAESRQIGNHPATECGEEGKGTKSHLRLVPDLPTTLGLDIPPPPKVKPLQKRGKGHTPLSTKELHDHIRTIPHEWGNKRIRDLLRQ